MFGGIRDTRGTTALEFAVILPALLMFILGLLDCGRLLFSYTMLSQSVESAARCAAVNVTACASATATQSYAAGQAWGLGLTSSAYTQTVVACGAQVVGTMTFTFVIPWFFGTRPFGASNSMPLTATACYPT